MSANPSDTWFYNDWENDEKLKACSLAAQGLWMRLLCIAARSPERGVVQIGDLNLSLHDGLAQIALAVGRPLEEIAPLIDELVSSGAASVDRKKRLYNRRMVRAAKTSAARAQSGKNGAGVTNGKRWGKVDLGQQKVSKPSAPSFFIPPAPLLISPTGTAAGRAAADPGGPPRAPLPDSAKWAERLAGYEPWNGKHRWPWGAPPDAIGRRNPSLSNQQIVDWRARRDAAMKAMEPA